MSLINCPECARAGVSSTASSCPHCHFDLARMRYIAKRKRDIAICLIALVLLSLFTFYYFSTHRLFPRNELPTGPGQPTNQTRRR
jgi:uncharacterized paraquat-inducible protein A